MPAAGRRGDGYLDYREVIARKDVDAVIVATPDHWHAKIALAAMDAGKDVYCEKPMCHTIDEAHQLSNTVKETKRIMQVGSQTTSGDQWHKAKKAIADGAIGKMILSQGSYHRNSIEGEWNWPIDKEAGPNGKGDDYIDWKMWLGSAPKREYNADLIGPSEHWALGSAPCVPVQAGITGLRVVLATPPVVGLSV